MSVRDPVFPLCHPDAIYLLCTDGAAGPQLRRAGLGLRAALPGEYPGLHALHLPPVPGGRVRNASVQGSAGVLKTGEMFRIHTRRVGAL